MDCGVISWSSQKQPVIALSTIEAEYIASMHVTKDILWTLAFLTERAQPLAQPTTLFGDNQSAIALSNDNQFHACTKHIDVRYHFIRETMPRFRLGKEMVWPRELSYQTYLLSN